MKKLGCFLVVMIAASVGTVAAVGQESVCPARSVRAATATDDFFLVPNRELPGIGTRVQADQCTCNGAKATTHVVSCTRADGTKFNANGTCWQKYTLSGGKPCQQVCDSDYNVCSGHPGHCQ